jgi:hypothetical protein
MAAVVTWRIPLIGHEFDLEDFPLWLSDQQVQVEKQGDSYFLVLPCAVAGHGYEYVHAIASQHLELLNGIGRILYRAFRPISLADTFVGVNAAGGVVHTVVQPGSTEIRSKAGTLQVEIDGALYPDPTTNAASPYLKAAARAKEARSAIALLGKPNRTWTDLYNLFELVEADMGGRMYAMGWISKAKATKFTATANSFTTLGLQGRHGKDTGRAPINPVAHQEADKLILTLVEQWLKHKVSDLQQ